MSAFLKDSLDLQIFLQGGFFLKKLFALILILLCLCSCKGKEVKPQLSEISFTAELSYFNEGYIFDGQIKKDGTLIANMKEPEELSDLKLTVTPKGITADYKGLSYAANEATMPFSRIMSDFYSAVTELSKTQKLKTDKNGEAVGEIGDTGYTLVLSPTGLPQSLVLDAKHITVKFYNLSVKEE